MIILTTDRQNGEIGQGVGKEKRESGESGERSKDEGGRMVRAGGTVCIWSRREKEKRGRGSRESRRDCLLEETEKGKRQKTRERERERERKREREGGREK